MGRTKLGVIFGGTSTEHNVSIVSGTSIIKNLNKEKYEIYPIYIDLKGEWFKYTYNNEEFKVGDEIIGTEKIENIKVNSISLIYEDELKIENVQVINAENKTIRVTLEGTQTKYAINEVAEGATIVIRANISINNLTPTKTDKVQIK